MKIFNKTAPSSFTVQEKLEAGIMLTGSEVKALRLGHADITGSYVKIIGKEAFMVNSKIFPYQYSRTEGYQEDRSRKLLLHKKELLVLKSKLDQGNFTLVPLSMYLHRGMFKVEIALAKGKKQYEKRKDLRKKAMDRDIEQAMKNRR